MKRRGVSPGAESAPAQALPAALRMTRQRKVVFDALMSRCDHPTASEVYLGVRDEMPTISLATVYNCLETLTQAGLVKQVNMDREPSRYCANLRDHAHFHCGVCGKVLDVEIPSEPALTSLMQLPRGIRVERLDVSVRGVCPDCAAARLEEGLPAHQSRP